MTDETPKFGKKYEGFHAADSTGRMWVLGIRQLVTKSGKDTMAVLEEVLADIDDAAKVTGNKTSRQILTNIVSTMTDRAATEKKFSSLIETYRSDILREMYGDAWPQLREVEQLSLSKLNNFFCALHVLVHMAEVASKSLVEAEKSIDESEGNFKATEPGTTRLIRTASKAFARGGDEKSGVHGPFQAFVKPFLQQHKMTSIPLERFRGNRFNILFSNAANVFFLAPKMKEFLKAESGNRLLQSVGEDINNHTYLAVK